MKERMKKSGDGGRGRKVGVAMEFFSWPSRLAGIGDPYSTQNGLSVNLP